MSALWGALIGGGISLVTTLAVEVARSKREMRHRWDANGLAAIEHFVDIANRTIGALYDEGRARSRGDEQQSVADAARQARSHMDSFRVAYARARLTMPGLTQELVAYDTALRALKIHADHGFDNGDAHWKELQADLNSALNRLMEAAIATLRLRSH